MSALLHKLARSLQSLHWDGGSTTLAVSGGPDSVALLCAFHELHPEARLVIAHLNHQLRGDESDADEAFVAQLREQLGNPENVEYRHERMDVAAAAEGESANLEATARRIRYDWLRKVAQDTNSRWVATGHTADDQAETVLHRLLRGSGLRGLRGIAPRQLLSPQITLIRPLLSVTRAEVMEFLTSRQMEFRLDRTNLDLSFTRNRIRHELLPLLADKYNPDIARILAQLAEQAEEAYHATESRAQNLLRDVELPRAGQVLVFDRPRLAAAPRDLIREMFRLVWLRESWPENDMTFEAWDRLAAVACGEAPAADLPAGIRARARERVVQVGRLP
jgi:tRNA(Ile)-lysidine synthase